MAQQLKSKFIKSDAIDGSKVKFSFGQAIRGMNSLGQEVELFKLGSSNEALVKGQEIAFKSQVTALQTALEAAEASLTAALTQEVSDRQSDVNAKLVEAKGYTDSEIEKLTHLAPAALNTFKELADKLAEDEGVVSSVISTVSGISADLATEVSNRQAAVSAEQSAREAADSALQSQLETAIANAVGNASGSLSGDLSAETASRISADSVLDGKITTEKNRAESAEAGLSQDIADLESYVVSVNEARQASENVLDGKITTEKNRAEGVEASLSSAISSEESARISAINSVNSAISSEESARVAGDNALESALTAAEASFTSSLNSLGADLSQEVSDRQAADASKLLEAKAYTDGKISDLINGAPAMMDTLKEISDAIAAGDSVAVSLASQISSEVSRAEGEEARIEGKVDAETSARQAAISSVESSLTSAQSSFTAAINSEASARQSADTTLTNNLNSEISRAQAEEALMFKKDGSRQMTGGINMGGFGIGNLPTTGYPVNNNQASTKKYVDDSISTLQSSVTTAITNAVSAEATSRQTADTALDGRVTSLESKGFNKMKIIIDEASELSYVDLGHTAEANSIVAFVGRLAVHQGEDFSISVVGGKTRLTWMGDFAVGGVEAVENGDVIFVTYRK